MNTVITEKTDNGEVSYDVFSKLIESRILFLYDYIGDETATDIVATLLYLDHNNDQDKISLYINSEGGDIESIFMIYDMMKMIKSPIETLCIGTAFGEIALILAAGTPGMRYATKSSTVRVNQISFPYSMHGDMSDAEIAMGRNKMENKKFLQAFSDCTRKPIKHILHDTQREFYMSPEAAIKYGIIDAVVKRGDDEKISK